MPQDAAFFMGAALMFYIFKLIYPPPIKFHSFKFIAANYMQHGTALYRIFGTLDATLWRLLFL
jgi:hypothetical protein